MRDSGILLYEPFGTQITPTSAFASANPTVPFAASTIPPANAQGSQSYAWAGGHRRSNETSFALAPVQMGARVYIPSMGRFLSVDPVEGGTMNNYAYVADPVNSDDYSGGFAFIPVIFAVARIAVAVVPIVMKAVRSPAVTRVIAQIASKASSVVQHVSRAVSGALNRAGGGSAGGTAANTGRAATSKATTTTMQKTTPQMQGYQKSQSFQGSMGGPTAGRPFSSSVKTQIRSNNETCAYCGRVPDKPEIDHIIARSKGGNATIGNAQLTCQWCNRSKGAALPLKTRHLTLKEIGYGEFR